MSDENSFHIGIDIGGNPESPWIVRTLGSLGGLAGIVSLFWTSGSPTHVLEWVRLGGAVGFVVAVIDDLVAARRKETQKVSDWFSAFFVLLLAFDRASSPTKHVAQPWWMTVLAAVIGAAALATLPTIYRLWRARSDERDRAIVQGSMSFAFVCTLVGLLAYSLLQGLKVAPNLNSDYVLWTAIGAWVGAYFWLQRRM